MATSLKRKQDDEFVFTLSDNEESMINGDEELPASPPPSKRRRTEEPSGQKKKGKKAKAKAKHAPVEDVRALWGAKEEDDGAMDSEFEFALEPNGVGVEEDFEGWGFEGAKKGLGLQKGDKKATDIDEIIARRKDRANGAEDDGTKETKEGGMDAEASMTNSESEAAELDLSGIEDDELFARDGFGMDVGPDEEESGDNDKRHSLEREDDVDGPEYSDDESVASPAPHPDDLDAGGSSGDEDKHEDSAEMARQKAFFAPEEKPAPGAKSASHVSFQSMSLSRPILRGLAAVGFTQPTPIQAKTIPIALLGKDVVGGAVTGSGKTAAFMIPVLERLLYRPRKVQTSRVAILMPTRELAIQCHAVATKLASHTDIKFCLAVGGLSLKIQEAELRLRPDVIIATPGRFIDHMRNSPSFTVDTLEILVLDEADRMLEAGFADELNEILTTIPKSRQTMLFSATMTSSVDNLIRVGLKRPVRLMVDSQKQTVGTLVQEFVRLRPGRESKRMGYLLYLCSQVYTDGVIIFFRQKKEAHRTRVIFGLSGLKATELHGSMSQEQRIASIEAFRDSKASFLLATDLASRGLDIKGITTVINYEAPQSHEIYLHRVGRTARAGRSGRACTIAGEPDRKIVKAAVKSAHSQGATMVSRVIDATEADDWQAKVDAMETEIEAVLKEEKEDKVLKEAEMQIKKGENRIVHQEEIMGRPKRTWFESEAEKKKAKLVGKRELNGEVGKGKKKEGKLSNKDKKKLDDDRDRGEGRMWKKGKAERAGKGALILKEKGKGKKKVKGGKPPSKKFGKAGAVGKRR